MKEYLISVKNITKYSVKMFFRDRRAIYFSLFLPLMIMTIFGVMRFDQAAKIKLAVVDEAKNQKTSPLVEAIKKVDAFQVSEGDLSTERKDLEKGNLDMVLVLPKNFGADIGRPNTQAKPTSLDLLINESKPQATTQTGATILNQVLDGYTHAVTKTPYLFTLEQKGVTSRRLSYVDFLLPGIVSLSIMQMGIFGVAGSFVTWRERGIFRRLFATPVRPGVIIFSQVFTRLLLSILQVSVILVAGVFLFHVTIVGSLPIVFLLALFGGLVFLNLGFTVSGIGNSQNTVLVMANLIMMPQMFLAGVFFPRETFPEWLKTVTHFLPLTYLADAMRSVMIEGQSLMQVRGDLLGLLAWGIISFIIATRLFRWE